MNTWEQIAVPGADHCDRKGCSEVATFIVWNATAGDTARFRCDVHAMNWPCVKPVVKTELRA